MATIIHMETELVRQMAQQLNETAVNINDVISSLAGTVQSADWQGNSRYEFEAEFQRLASQLKTLTEQATDLSQKVQREVAEWETISGSFGSMSAQPGLAVNYLGLIGETTVLGTAVEGENWVQPNPLNEGIGKIWDGAKAVINTAGFITNNTVLKKVNEAAGTIDFFFKKMPETEKAFRAWEDYNRKLDGWDPVVARQLQENAKKHLEALGLSGVQDAVGFITKELGSHQLVRKSIEELNDAVSVVTDWIGALSSNK